MSKVVRLRKRVPALLKQKQGAADPAPRHFLVALYDELDCGESRVLLEQRAHLPIEIQENSMPAFLAFSLDGCSSLLGIWLQEVASLCHLLQT